MSDLIDRDETIKQFCKQDCGCDPRDCPGKTCYEVEIIESVPTHTTPANTLGALDCVSREDLTKGIETYFGDLPITVHYDMLALAQKLPSVQPERTCVNCGRTANNGGWYADGGTRCPIEEHYALPKDGYCHLWEKRNVTDGFESELPFL